MEKRPLDPPELSDGVIRLRRMTEADIDAVLQTFADEPDLGETMGFQEDPTREKMLEWLPTRDSGVWMGGFEGERYVGDIAVHHVDWDHDRAELGFYVHHSCRGRGWGTRMVAQMRDWLHSEGFLRVQMLTLPGNEGVHGIARRAGFAREGLLHSYFVERGKAVDAVIFSSINPKWVKR